MRVKKAAFLCLLTFACLLSGQEKNKRRKNGLLQVQIKTSKKTYAPGEPVRFTAILRNGEDTVLYISKSFSEAGGGISGFYVSVKQLTGTLSGVVCGGNGDRGIEQDARTPEQILREDYLALPPGAIVGLEAQYKGCVVKNIGSYQITATYSAQDLNLKRVREIAGMADRIVAGEFRSKPSTFNVK